MRGCEAAQDKPLVRIKMTRGRFSLILATLISLLPASRPLPETIKIGGLFDVTDTVQEIAFR